VVEPLEALIDFVNREANLISPMDCASVDIILGAWWTDFGSWIFFLKPQGVRDEKVDVGGIIVSIYARWQYFSSHRGSRAPAADYRPVFFLEMMMPFPLRLIETPGDSTTVDRSRASHLDAQGTRIGSSSDGPYTRRVR